VIKGILVLAGLALVLALIALLGFVFVVQNVEQPDYAVVVADNAFEVRDYPPLVVAEVTTSGERREALGDGFRPLARYIFAREREGQGIAMTAPVQQRRVADDEKIAMTVPVVQSRAGDDAWRVQFVMPSAYRIEDLPVPANAAVSLREVPRRRVAAVRFSGRADDALLAEQEARLRDWMAQRGLTPSGQPPLYAYYNDPLTPGFLRRNEIMFHLHGD
jgi:DNA gyrase inhibitor GyrI